MGQAEADQGQEVTVAVEPASDSEFRDWLLSLPEEEYVHTIDTDTRAWVMATGVTIAPKVGPRIPLRPKLAQLEFEAIMERQRAEGKPVRVIILKSRQVGISTWCQAKMIHRATRMANHQSLTVAHDRKTGGKLYRMGQGVWASLPEGMVGPHPIKPGVKSSRKGHHLHFAPADYASWAEGRMWPDSEYDVDTAGEYDAGRGGTFHSLHLSELAFWGDAETKLGGLKSCVPQAPETLVAIESTPNGHNYFKDEWDLAVAGESDYAPFFFPWWRHEEYRRPFLNPGDREALKIGEHRWGEEEPALVALMEGYDELEILERLNWRRSTIANECSGNLATFKREYASTPEEAFLGSGNRVFDAERVSVLIGECELQNADDPPLVGQLRHTDTREEEGRSGMVEIPERPLWVPYGDLEPGEKAPWSIWLPFEEGKVEVPEAQYIVSVDVSGGQVEEGGREPAMHAIEVIDHLTGDQVAEYASRVDPHMLVREIYLAALLFRNALVVVERTGGWGLPIIYTLYYDWHWPRLYRHKKRGTSREHTDQRLGFSTDGKTKPIVIAGAQELVNTEATGIRSAVLARELQTYVRDPETADTMKRLRPEPGKFADRLMAWSIGQYVRTEIPVVPDSEELVVAWRPRSTLTGY